MVALDAEELLHLAMHAVEQNEPQKAIEHLKHCLELETNNAKATYLLGAMYAQLGMYSRAKQLMQQAVALNPKEFTAVFQLGLLHLTGGDVEIARDVWSGLDALPEDHSLYLFKSAFLSLVEDDFAHCIALIDRGIEHNNFNDALNDDMRAIRAKAEAALEKNVSDAQISVEQSNETINRFALNDYQQATNTQRR